MLRQSMFGAALLLACTPAFAADRFEAGLDPAPFDAANRAIVIGSIGTASARLDGSILTVSGTFSNLTSPATTAQLRSGLAMGVPGDAIGSLTVTHGTQGTVSGSVKLTPAQVTALQGKTIYIRIDSEKAPDGNLQGWLVGSN